MQLALGTDGPALAPISPRREMGAYEAMWLEKGATFKTLAEKFARDPSALPSDFVAASVADRCAQDMLERLKKLGVDRFGVRLHHAGDYPSRLRDARYPVEMLYYRGTWELAESRSVAVVGSRNASEMGLRRAGQIARDLVKKGFTVVSGLAKGVDTAAHQSALDNGGNTIAVVGTPLGHIYPKSNIDLQERIASEHLLVSQVPLLRYEQQHVPQNRLFFPERNITMCALTEATIIVEAGETSGTLIQARAAMFQGRKLFILDSCFQRTDITWPQKYLAEGAIRVREMDDIWEALG